MQRLLNKGKEGENHSFVFQLLNCFRKKDLPRVKSLVKHYSCLKVIKDQTQFIAALRNPIWEKLQFSRIIGRIKSAANINMSKNWKIFEKNCVDLKQSTLNWRRIDFRIILQRSTWKKTFQIINSELTFSEIFVSILVVSKRFSSKRTWTWVKLLTTWMTKLISIEFFLAVEKCRQFWKLFNLWTSCWSSRWSI